MPQPPERLVALEDAGDPIPRFDDPFVWISEPDDNAAVNRTVLFTHPGIEIMFDGTFVPGYGLNLLAARVETPDLGFHIQRIPITDSMAPGPIFVRGSPTLVGPSDRIRLKLRAYDERDLLLSIDSVTLRLR